MQPADQSLIEMQDTTGKQLDELQGTLGSLESVAHPKRPQLAGPKLPVQRRRSKSRRDKARKRRARRA